MAELRITEFTGAGVHAAIPQIRTAVAGLAHRPRAVCAIRKAERPGKNVETLSK